MSFIAYQIKKLVAQRIMVKTTSRSDRPWSAIFCVIVYCIKLFMMNIEPISFRSFSRYDEICFPSRIGKYHRIAIFTQGMIIKIKKTCQFRLGNITIQYRPKLIPPGIKLIKNQRKCTVTLCLIN